MINTSNKYLININLGLILIFFFSCSNSGNNKKTLTGVNDTLKPVEYRYEQKKPSTSLEKEQHTAKISLLNFKVSKIISCQKMLNENSRFYSEYFNKCEMWNLNENDIADILQKSEVIDGQKFSYYFDVLPCYYYGEVVINDSINVKFEINAGSSSTIVLSDTSYLMGYYGNKKYFILKPGLD
jgi:hypothetical protein